MSLLAQDERLARRVGAVTLCLLGAAIVFVVFVLDRIDLGDHTRIQIHMRSTGGLREGAPLVLAGRDVGRIETIARSPHGAPGPLGGEEGVVITVALDPDDAAHIRRGADVFVASRGVLSARYLEVGPLPETGEPIGEGEAILGIDPPSMDRVVQRTWDDLMIAKRFADEVSPEVDALRAQLDQLDSNLAQVSPTVVGLPVLGLEIQALAAEARRTYAGLGGAHGLARVDAVLARGRQTIATARGSLADLRTRADQLIDATRALQARVGPRGAAAVASLELAVDRARAAIDQIDPLLAKIDELSDRIARGEGSIGRLMNDPEFPEDAKELGKILKRKPWRVIAKPKD